MPVDLPEREDPNNDGASQGWPVRQGSTGGSSNSAGRSDASYTFFEQLELTHWDPNAQTWGTWYTLELPSGGVPIVTQIEMMIVNGSEGTTYDPAVVLIELYDTFDDSLDPIHGAYLGGVVLDFGKLEPYGVFQALFDAAPGSHYFSTGDDDAVFISAYVGTIVDDRFVELAEPNTLCMTFGLGLTTAPTVGGAFPQFWRDDEGDRIYDRTGDGPYWYDTESYLGIVFRGELAGDCNLNAYAEGAELDCGRANNCHTIADDCVCDSEECELYTGTDGLFEDPLGLGYTVPAVCDDSPSNGIPDWCDDCNSNGIPDVCERDCSAINPNPPNNVCSNDFPAECGLLEDCDSSSLLDVCQIRRNSSAPSPPYLCNPATQYCDPDCNSNAVPDECEMIATGDFDADGDVDLFDYAALADCLGGPGLAPTPPAPQCAELYLDAFDGDEDSDVDLQDFAAFQMVFGGT